MSDEQALVPLAAQSPMGLDHNILSKLNTYDEFLQFNLQLNEATAQFSWLKADTLLRMSEKLGDTALAKIASDLREKKSTVINYVRTAKAYPIEKREPMVSFSAHYHASFADSLNDRTNTFDGEKRFEWIKRAAEEGLSVREITHGIQKEKREELAKNNEEEAYKFDAHNKGTELKSLIDGLMLGARQGDKEAYEKLVAVYKKVFS